MLDTFTLWIAIHLPRRIRYWATMQMIGEVIGPDFDPNLTKVSLREIMLKLEKKKYARSEH